MLGFQEQNKDRDKDNEEQFFHDDPIIKADSPLSETDNEVDDKILHEDADDYETEDKIDDMELGEENDSNAVDDDETDNTNVD